MIDLTPDAILSKFRGTDDTEVWLWMMDISHPTIETIRLVHNAEDVVSNGNLYTASRFEPTLPRDSAEELSRPNLSVYDATQTLTETLRLLPTQNSPRAVISTFIVLASDLDHIQSGPIRFVVLNNDIAESGVVSMTLGFRDLVREGMGDLFTPTLYPSMI